jgi:mannosyltransferase
MSGEPTISGDGGPKGPSVRGQGSVWISLHNRSDLIFRVLIGLAVTTALLLRWSGLSSQSLWFDEGYTLWMSRFSPKDIWHILPIDTSSPLYYILLHYWTKCFGNSEFSLRALSALFGTISIPLFYLLARKILADKWSVVLAMMLYAVSFFQIWYAQEARCYALLVFLSLGSIYCLLLSLDSRNTLRLCGLVLFLTASLYTHNMAVFYLPGLAVVWLVYPAESTIRARVRDALLVFAGALLLYLPWLPTLRGQLERIHRGFGTAAPKARDLLDSLCVLSGFDTRTLQIIFRDRLHTVRLFGFWTWVPAVFIIVVLCVLGGLCALRSEDRRKVAALLAYSLTPVFLVFIDSRISNPIYVNRVFLGSCVLLPMLFCAPIAFQVGNGRKVFQIIAFVVLVGTAVSAFGYLRRERREDWRGVTEYLVRIPEERRLSVIVPDMGQVLVQYYASGLSQSYAPIEVTGLLTRFDPPDLSLEARTLEDIDRNADVLALLSRAVASGKYKEVDVAMQPGTMRVLVAPTLQYLAAHCGSVDIVEFHWLEVRRCFVQSPVGH